MTAPQPARPGEPTRWRKKPVFVDAWQVTPQNVRDVAHWCAGSAYTFPDNDAAYIDIVTLEGTMTASLGDFVIKGVSGEFYPCKPDIFAALYEPVVGRGAADGGEPA